MENDDSLKLLFLVVMYVLPVYITRFIGIPDWPHYNTMIISLNSQKLLHLLVPLGIYLGYLQGWF